MFTYSLYKIEMVDICDISCVTKYAYEIYRYDNCQGYTQYVGYGICVMGRYQILGNLVGLVVWYKLLIRGPIQ